MIYRNSAVMKMKKSWQLYVLFMLPLLYILIFKYYPMYGAQIAFKNFNPTLGIGGSDWVGFKHFNRFFASFEFNRLIKNTLILAFYELIAGFPLPIFLALSINIAKNHLFKKTVQMVTYAPHFISVVVMSGIILQFLSPRAGIVNNLLSFVGVGPINFMASPAWFPSIFVWSGIWQNAGFGCVIYLAALSSIDPSLHEAAVVDGASKIRRMWHIDLPGIMPIAIILLILDTGRILDIGFEKVFLLQNPLNLRASEIIDTYVYKVGIVSPAANYSYAATIGLFKSVIGLVLLVTVNQAAKKSGQSLW